MSTDKQGTLGIHFCPYCHNVRIIEKQNQYAFQECNRCKSEMIFTMTKDEFDSKSTDEKKNIINGLKSQYAEVASPTEILLQRLYENNKVITHNLAIIKGIMVFYLVMSILGALILFFSLL